MVKHETCTKHETCIKFVKAGGGVGSGGDGGVHTHVFPMHGFACKGTMDFGFVIDEKDVNTRSQHKTSIRP